MTNTVAGAGIGALIGGAVAGRDDRGKGAVIGGIGGALVGSQVGKPKTDCARAYGFYDDNGLWHANAVERSAATGYYDREGRWVDGQPNGHYDARGRWISNKDSRGQTLNASYHSNSGWRDAPAGLNNRQAWLKQKIRSGMNEGALSRNEGARGLRSLDEIDRDEQRLRRAGRFGPKSERLMLARLDDVNDNLRWGRSGGARYN